MSGLLKPNQRRVMIVLIVAVVVAAVAVAVVLKSPDRDSADPSRITFAALISDFVQAEVDAASIPADSLSTVEANLTEAARRLGQPGVKGGSPLRILPASVRDRMDQANAACQRRYCSSAWQERHADDVSLSSVMETGLRCSAKNTRYNALEPLAVRAETRLLASAVKSNDGQTTIVWGYTWRGEVTTQGKGGQYWEVCEYRFVMEKGRWRVDACSVLATADSTSATNAWGPYSPHTSIATAEMQGRQSAVSSDQSVIRSQLQELEETAQKAATDT